MFIDSATSTSLTTPHSLAAAPVVATLVVDDMLRVLSADAAGRAALVDEGVIRLSLGRLCTGNHGANARIREGVAAGQPASDLRVAVEGRRTLVVSIMPVAAFGDDAMRIRQAVLLVRTEASAVDPVAQVATECRLTAAERDVLRLIFKGLNTVEASGVMAVAKTTIRTHLKHIFEKTETSRQSELVHFVATFEAA